jgi:hypothetical protein
LHAEASNQPPLLLWAVYDLKGTPAKLVGIIDNAPGEAKAIERAIEEHKVRTNEREQ